MHQEWLTKIINKIKAICRPPLVWLTKIYRKQFKKVVFIGVTGSSGKTTTKDLIAAILSEKYEGIKNKESFNTLYSIIKTIFKVKSWHRFCVQEIGIDNSGPGTLNDPLAVFMPDIGIVTNIGLDHYKAFRSLEAIAAEKSKLIEALPKNGTAVLNADDTYVLAMKDKTDANVITYGLSKGAMIRAENISSAWPSRLSFKVIYNGKSIPVKTNLCGTHWVYCVLAALAVGLTIGIPLAEGVKAVQTIKPTPGRMSPVYSKNGVVFIRDDWKAPLWSIRHSLEFMKNAKAKRKVIVIGTISDYSEKGARIYVSIAKQSLSIADKVIFVGHLAHCSLKAKRNPKDDNILAFDTVKEISMYLKRFLIKGDMVLIKGSLRADHLQRIILVRTSQVRCWKPKCGKILFCSDCKLLQRTSSLNL